MGPQVSLSAFPEHPSGGAGTEEAALRCAGWGSLGKWSGWARGGCEWGYLTGEYLDQNLPTSHGS